MPRLKESGVLSNDYPQVLGADKSAFVTRLQTILTHWPNADRLARAMGVSPSAFRKWLKGEAEPSRERLVALAHATGVGVAWLAEGAGPAPSFEPVAGPRRRAGRAAGPPEEHDWSQFIALPDKPPNPTEPPPPVTGRFLALRLDWARATFGPSAEHLSVGFATDESMAPTLKSGNLVLIDTADRTIRSCCIYVLEASGQRMIRRVQCLHDGSLVLISDNSAYLTDKVDSGSTSKLSVIGRVVWAGGAV